MLEISNVSMSYSKSRRYKEIFKYPFKKLYTNAISNVNIDIQNGDKVAFLGPNGAGKTTLLKLIGGLLFPTTGYIKVDGYDTIASNIEARKSVGYILNEERSFYWRLSGFQNLEFFGALDNLFGASLHQKIYELIDLVGLKGAESGLVGTYSSGMKQKLAIARGLLSDPKILILDEPTRTLDPIAAEEVKNLITKKMQHEKERTLLIATHRLEEAEAICNKICVVNKGNIVYYGLIKEIKEQYPDLMHFYTEIIK